MPVSRVFSFGFFLFVFFFLSGFCFDLFYALRVSTLRFCFLPLHNIPSLLTRQIMGYINETKNTSVWCLMLLHQMTGKFRLKCANVFDFLRSFYAEGGWRTAKCSLRIDGNDNILKNHSFSKPFFSFQCVVQNNWIRIRCQISHRIIDWVNQPNSVLLSWRKVSCSF